MFRFRLQTVLEVRERMARLRQKEYAETLARRQALLAQTNEHERGLARAARQLDLANQSHPTVFAMQQYSAYRERMKGEMALLEEQLREQAQELEARRNALVEARREQRTLELLRDKELKRYEQAENRRERSTMDEVASNYHVFRQA